MLGRAVGPGLGMALGVWLMAAGAALAAKPPIPLPIVVVKAPEGAKARSARLVGYTFNQTPETRIGYLELSPLCVPQDPIYLGDLSRVSKTDFLEVFQREARAAGFPVAGEVGDLFSSEDTAQFEIGARITKVEGNLCSPLYGAEAMKGWVVVDVEWQVYSRAKRAVVARIPVKGVFERKQTGKPEGVFLGGFAESVKGLINNQTYRDLVLNPEPDVTAGVGAPSAIALAAGVTTAKVARPPISLGKPERKPDGLPEVVGSVVTVIADGGHGSGFLVSADGYVLTNAHVVGETKTVKVRWSDNFETVGEVLRTEKGRDVALIKTDSRSRLPLALRRNGASLGQEVYAVGAPLDIGLSGTVTRGIVSTTNRIFDGYAFIQSDVQVTHGNSGGPLVNKDGEVLGLTVSGYRPDGTTNAVNLFIPAGDAMDFLALN
jgi:serine protease Do